MKLATKTISKKAQRQYDQGSDLDQQVVAKFFTPWSNWTWYLMNQDPEDADYMWGIVKSDDVEMGSFLLSDLESLNGPYGLKIERDLHFRPMKARDVWDRLIGGGHI